MLCVKTGMASEYAVAKQFAAADVQLLTGVQTVADLETHVAADCRAIISFGLCGGLSPQAQIGQSFIYSACVTPDAVIAADAAWSHRLFSATRYYERKVFSSGLFNTANSIAQRADLLRTHGCWIIDDETRAVAEFAQGRGIAWAGLRVVSDGAEDELPPTVVNALNPDGTANIEAVVASVVQNPAQLPALIQTAREFEFSIAELRTAAHAIGPHFQWRTQ